MRKMMRGIVEDRGASFVIALIFLLICTLVATVIVNFSGANAERSTAHVEEEQAYFDSVSAINFVRDVYGKDPKLFCTFSSSTDSGTMSYGNMDLSSDIAKWTAQWTKTAFQEYQSGYSPSTSSKDFTVSVAGGKASVSDDTTSSDVVVSLTMEADFSIVAKIEKGSSAEYPYELETTISPVGAISYDGNGNPNYPFTVTWYTAS